MTQETLLTPPALDEIEVSIFGPGKGEAVAVHLGGGRWMTVDSCVNQRTNQHPVLEYFERIGVDPATQIDLVVATHAHDDHTAGISRIMEVAKRANFVTSFAFGGEEFFSTVAADSRLEKELRHSVRSEFKAVFTLLRNEKGRRPTRIVRAVEQLPLYANPGLWDGGPAISVQALSPSQTAVERALKHLANELSADGTRRGLKAQDPNDASVAIWLHVGDVAVLLGADLEIGPTGCGWKAVETSHQPSDKASLFKVPHHGSAGAHHEPTWSELLDPSVIAVLAPFRSGSSNVPKPADERRIADRAGAAYSTARAKDVAPSAGVKAARARLPQIAQRVRDENGVPGHVQARRVYGAEAWSVALDGPAYALEG